MFTISAKTQHLNLQGTKRVWSFAFIGIIISGILGILILDLWVTIGLISLFLATFIVLYRKPEDTQVVLTKQGISFNDNQISWLECGSWSMVDLHDKLEIVIFTHRIPRAFYYFYLNPEDPKLKEFIKTIDLYLEYDELSPNRNIFHVLFRIFGLR